MTETITLVEAHNGVPLMLLPLGDDAPRYSGGATWENISRPRRKALTNFTGEEPWVCTMKIMLNAWPDGDVEPEMYVLETKTRRLEQNIEPETVRLLGRAMAHSELTWVLEKIDDSGQVLRRSDGRRCRQELTLTFREYVSPPLLIREPSPAEAAQQRAGR